MRIRYHPDAVVELTEAARYYEEQQPGLGGRFLDSVEASLSLLEKDPQIWRADSRGRRKYLVRRFPYLILYKYQDGQIYVLAIAHTKRKPGYWKTRD